MQPYDNPTDAFARLLGDVYTQGEDVTVRNSLTKELLGASVTIYHPQQRCLIMPKRHDNIFAKIAESLWVLSGRNDIEWLSYYLPRAPEWADDGYHWRAGYGPRLRAWPSSFHTQPVVDQVEQCLMLLVNDPTTRRAVMSLWNPAEDYAESKDIPCNNWLHWLVRNDQLHLFVTQRSSDILWGFSGINLFEWSVLQEFMANWLGIGVGPITYNISSLHLYEQHFKRAGDIISQWNGRTIYDFPGIKTVPMTATFARLDFQLLSIFLDESAWRLGEPFHDRYDGGYLSACARMLFLYICDRRISEGMAINERCDWLTLAIELLPENTDFKLAAIEYYARKMPELWYKIHMTDAERAALWGIGVLP